ncbi:hypothetical protein OCHUTO_1064 [Orientia chuto str. Dubai]|uniref:Uncharacterized protein n=1 Tax=Orientia chuto str. Dubai TaxID=1359168 RepID=A0A0F3MGN1_9RICK|nr:hypothetical protein [Candidatus Orientia mediorientalis]KJV54821.1 hypothetical protein OCHUTO_1064 [Orientia chuto str. Dubai]
MKDSKQFICKVIIRDRPVISLAGVVILVTFVFYVITQKEEPVQSLEKRESREEISGVGTSCRPKG